METAPFKGYSDPLEIVDRTEMDYEERLALLQDWRAELAAQGAGAKALDAVDGAIQALEKGAEVQGDGPSEGSSETGFVNPKVM